MGFQPNGSSKKDESDSDGLEDVEDHPIPQGLLRAAGVESDEDYEAIPSATSRKVTRLKAAAGKK